MEGTVTDSSNDGRVSISAVALSGFSISSSRAIHIHSDRTEIFIEWMDSCKLRFACRQFLTSMWRCCWPSSALIHLFLTSAAVSNGCLNGCLVENFNFGKKKEKLPFISGRFLSAKLMAEIKEETALPAFKSPLCSTPLSSH